MTTLHPFHVGQFKQRDVVAAICAVFFHFLHRGFDFP
jgi:hypothetical protein